MKQMEEDSRNHIYPVDSLATVNLDQSVNNLSLTLNSAASGLVHTPLATPAAGTSSAVRHFNSSADVHQTRSARKLTFRARGMSTIGMTPDRMATIFRHEWSLHFADEEMEEKWAVYRGSSRRVLSFWLSIFGTIVFGILGLTDISSEDYGNTDGIDAFSLWKLTVREVCTGVACLLLAAEYFIVCCRPYWMFSRAILISMCCLWSSIFGPLGGLAKLMSAPTLGVVNGSDFFLREIRLHPSWFLLLWSGPVFDLPIPMVAVISCLPGIAEIALGISADLYARRMLILDHVGVVVLVVLVSIMAAIFSERTARIVFYQNQYLTQENVRLVHELNEHTKEKPKGPDLQSASEKLLALLNALRKNFGGDMPELEAAIRMIRNSDNIFTPNVESLENADMDDSIKEWLLNGPARLKDGQTTRRVMSFSVGPHATAGPEKTASAAVFSALPSPGSAMQEFLRVADFSQFCLDIPALENTIPHLLAIVTEAILVNMDLVTIFALSTRPLHLFLRRLHEGYVRTNPYHNASHASSVVWDMQYYLNIGHVGRNLTNVEKLAAIFAAASHDFKHPGRTNQYLVNVGDELAIQHNDKSVLERFHLAETFRLGTSEDCPVFKDLDKDSYKRFRHVMIDMVLATDLSQHFQLVAKLKTKASTPEDATGDAPVTSVELLMESCIVLCDLGHAAKEFDLHRTWSYRVTEEFFLQGDAEKAAGMEISPLCNRATTDIPKSQVGFLEFMVTPFFTAVRDALHIRMFDVQMGNIQNNATTWKKIAADRAAALATTLPGSTSRV